MPEARREAHVGGHHARQLEQVVINQEEPAEAMVFDECQLFRQPPLGIGAVGGALRVALAQLGAAQLGERLRRRCAIGTAEIGEGVSQIARQIERPTALGDG